MAYERWLYGDPFEIIARKQAIEARRRPRMTQEQADEVENLLEDWYHWARAQREFLGHSRVSPMFRGAESSDVHATSDDVDARLQNITAEMVDACLNELKVMERAAIEVHLRNKVARVHRNPRLGPPAQQHEAYLAAKDALFPILLRKGLVKRHEVRYSTG